MHADIYKPVLWRSNIKYPLVFYLDIGKYIYNALRSKQSYCA